MNGYLRIIYSLAVLLLFSFVAEAEDEWVRIKLSNGLEYEAKVEHQTDAVIVFQTVQGKRYQHSMADVVDIAPIEEVVVKEDNRVKYKSFGIKVQLESGLVFRDDKVGWGVNGGLQFGAANVLKKRIFIGGGIGVNVCQIDGSGIFIPVTASFSMPLMQTADAPYVGLECGYGFAVRGAKKGGFAGGFQIGWLHRFESETVIMLALSGRLQQGTFNVSEQISGSEFDYTARRLISQIGLQFAVNL